MAHREHLAFWTVALAAATGGYLSDVVIYSLGRKYKESPRLRAALENPKVAHVVAKLSLNIVLFALIFRFIPGMRTAGPIALASLGMPPLQYGFYTGIAALVWGVTGVMLGYYLGNTVEAIFGELHRIEHALIAPAIVAVVLGGAIYLWRRHSALTANWRSR